MSWGVLVLYSQTPAARKGVSESDTEAVRFLPAEDVSVDSPLIESFI
jgi:hypothetical protein